MLRVDARSTLEPGSCLTLHPPPAVSRFKDGLKTPEHSAHSSAHPESVLKMLVDEGCRPEAATERALGKQPSFGWGSSAAA